MNYFSANLQVDPTLGDHLGNNWLADDLSETWALRDCFFAMGCILLRECFLDQLLKDFFNSWDLLFFSSFFLFNERKSVTFYNHCNKCEHYEDI